MWVCSFVCARRKERSWGHFFDVYYFSFSIFIAVCKWITSECFQACCLRWRFFFGCCSFSLFHFNSPHCFLCKFGECSFFFLTLKTHTLNCFSSLHILPFFYCISAPITWVPCSFGLRFTALLIGLGQRHRWTVNLLFVVDVASCFFYVGFCVCLCVLFIPRFCFRWHRGASELSALLHCVHANAVFVAFAARY